MSWYYTSAGVQLGPVEESTLRALAASGRLLPTDLVWRNGMPAWQPAGTVPGLLPGAAAVPPPGFQPPPYGAAVPLPPPASSGADPALQWVLPVGRSGWAIAAGYLGLFSLLLVFAPFAILTGVLGLREIKKNPRLGGRGRAIFGIVMGSLVTIGFLAALLASR